MRASVLVTGVGVVAPGLAGGARALHEFLTEPYPLTGPDGPAAVTIPAGLIDEAESRRLSRVCQLTVAAARLALADAGLADGKALGLVVGSEFGDLRSTVVFADGFLGGGPAGLSALLFPSTVMNTMAAATTVAVGAQGRTLTLNAPAVAGELAVARAVAAVAAGRAPALLAGGVDEFDPYLLRMLDALGAPCEPRAEGAAFLVLESADCAAGRGARVLGEIVGAASGALPARPHGVGRVSASPVVGRALRAARLDAADVAGVYASASGDEARDAWEDRVLDAALAPARPPRAALRQRLGGGAVAGGLSVAAAAWSARSGRLPGTNGEWRAPAAGGRGAWLVHGLARGGTQVALVVR